MWTLKGKPFPFPTYSSLTMANNEDFISILGALRLAPLSPIPAGFNFSSYLTPPLIMTIYCYYYPSSIHAFTSVHSKSPTQVTGQFSENILASPQHSIFSTIFYIFYPLLPSYFSSSLLSTSLQYHLTQYHSL